MTKAMLTRQEAEELIKKQLDGKIDYPDKSAHHYGKVELRHLLDEIYGAPEFLKELNEFFSSCPGKSMEAVVRHCWKHREVLKQILEKN